MLRRYKIPKTILWVINLFLIFLLIFTIFRFATYFAFKPKNFSFSDLLPSFLMGVQYDLRWIAIIILPVVLISMFPKFSPFYSSRNKKWWTWYLAIITFIVFFFFAADFGSFSYNRTRLDAGAMNFAEDFNTSWRMMWQTYPMIWMILGLLVAVFFFRWMYHKSHWRVINKTDGLGIPYRRKFFIIAAIVLCLFMYGRFASSPLTWKQCFVFQDNFKSYLALNPLQNFFTTLKFRRPEFNEQKARQAFPLMKEMLQLPAENQFSYHRQVLPGSNAIESRPNIVLVMCESFSMYKSTMSGNPLNTTPFFDSLSQKGIFFERCFSPHFSTARGLFAILTGIPDAQMFKFSTRNPLALSQHTIINNFEGYSKHYFLGGNPEFNNFKGLLDNIHGLQMHTETSFSAPRINVWGISDKDLFLAANGTFKKQTQPFFAIIQTSDNHRPYMIPAKDTDFVKSVVAEEQLQKYGFESLDEYNTFRYSDYSFRKFMEAAMKEDYFHNTSFGYFRTRREHDDAIRTIGGGLRPEGFLVIDYLNIHYAEAHLVPNEIKKIETTTYDIHRWHDETHFFKKINIIDPSLPEPISFTEKIAKLNLGEFTDMLSFQSLQVQEVFGDYQLSPYDIHKTPRLLIIAKKKGMESGDREKRLYSDGRSTDALT